MTKTQKTPALPCLSCSGRLLTMLLKVVWYGDQKKLSMTYVLSVMGVVNKLPRDRGRAAPASHKRESGPFLERLDIIPHFVHDVH